MMSKRDVPGAQRRDRRKVQASVQDLLILIERFVILGSLNRANAKGLLWRPASLGEDQPTRIGSAPEQACQFKRLVTFRTGRHQPRKLQGVYSEGTPIIPTS
jgi:hypothetical protein